MKPIGADREPSGRTLDDPLRDGGRRFTLKGTRIARTERSAAGRSAVDRPLGRFFLL